MRARRLLAATALIGLLVGIPAVILLVSGPPPTHLPGRHQLAGVLTRPLSDAGVLRGVAVAGWVLWALFALAVVAELVAAARHRPSPGEAAAGFRVPGLQGLAAALVVSALLSGGARHGPPAPATPGGGPALLTGAATAGAPPTTAPPALPAGATAAPPAPVAPGYVPYTVVPYDSPWAIAEAHLGNGLRWPQILDDQGRSLVDGQVVVSAPWGPATEDTARTIYPGQVLLLPPDATGVAPPTGPAAPPAPATAPPRVTPPAQPPTTVWTGTLPAEAGFVAPARTPVELTAARTSLTGPVEPGPQLPVRDLVLGGALVASAGVNVLAFRRARQTGAARRGERAPAVPDRLREAELRARAAADPRPAEIVRRALAAVDADLARSGDPPAPLAGLVVTGEEVEVVVGQPVTLPPPWRGGDRGRRWRRAVADLPGAPPSARHPGVVPVGQRPSDGAHVLVDLEATAVTALVGDDDRAAALLHGVALALAGLPWAGHADLVLVGFGDVLARCRSHVRSVGSVQAVATDLRAAAGGPIPTFVIARHFDRAGARLLREVCRPGTAVRALVAGDAGTADWLVIGPQGLELPWLAEPVLPAGVGAAELTGLDDLLRAALAAPVAAGRDAERPRAPDPPSEPEPPAGPAVCVQVLGPVEVTGLANDFRRPQAREVLVYLALHRPGAAEHEVDAALWPERPAVKPSTRDPVVSAARSAVGGTGRLPYAQGQGPDKRYRVTDQVGTDWERFRRLHQRGRAEGASGPLCAALELVRGRPFADVLAGPGYGWLHLEGHLHAVEAEVVDAADLAAELLLAEGDARRARWAARQGLTASPYSERLWAQLMAVADALGEAQEVERILAEMDRRLDLGGDFGQLHPDTLAAYRRYSRRTRAL